MLPASFHILSIIVISNITVTITWISLMFMSCVSRTLVSKRLNKSRSERAASPISSPRGEESTTLLMRDGGSACILTIVSYVLLQLLVLSNQISATSICRFEEHFDYSHMAKTVTLVTFFCFFVGCTLQIYQICVEGAWRRIGSSFTLHLTTFTINFIAGSSSFLTYFFGWGGICKV